MERELSVGGVFGTAFSVFGDRARVLVPISFAGALVVSATSALLAENAGVFVALIVDMAFLAFVTAVVMVVLRDQRERRPDSSATELMSSALPPLPAATLAASLAFVAVVVGIVFLVVPGLYLMTIWAVLLPVVVVERPGVFDAFGRARQLVRGNGWKVLGIVLLLGLILVGIGFPISFVLHRQVAGDVAPLLVNSLVSSLISPFQALVLGVLYYRLLDIEQNRQEQPPSVPEQTGDRLG